MGPEIGKMESMPEGSKGRTQPCKEAGGYVRRNIRRNVRRNVRSNGE